ncbi:MAG: 4Fe-4S binding protein [Rectinemataceae bacterium]|nr:4Fe-4S binding protein [Spirochaetaceae bacterium]
MANKGSIVIDRERCKGCLLCNRACPTKVLGVDSDPNSWGYFPAKAIAPEKCIACGNCFAVCPDVAITVYKL